MNLLRIKNSIIKLFLELFVLNRHKRSILKAKWAKCNLKKYTKLALSKQKKYQSQEESDEKIIWQYWHQGEENAPKIIKKCLDSIKKHYPDYKINVLSFDTIKNFVELPQRFYWLLENKKIPIALFSDILRLNLLSKYGGIWIDATMYATGKLPEEILGADYFMFQKNSKNDSMQNNNSCYFIKSKKNNSFLEAIKTTLEIYWSKNDFVINYFMFEHITTILSSSDILKEEWQKMPIVYTNNVCAIQDKKFEKINSDDFEKIINSTSIHKLTYKTIPSDYNEVDTYLGKLLQI